MYQHGQGVEQDIKQAVEYYQKGCEFGTTIVIISVRMLISVCWFKGDSHAHISMAHCYSHGRGVELSLEKAFENYLEASKSSMSAIIQKCCTLY